MSIQSFQQGFVKRAAEYGLNNNQIEQLYKLAAKKPDAKDILDMDSSTGGLADYLSTGAFGGSRAGRATAMAKATGQSVPFNVENPVTAATLSSLLGGGLGAGLGAGAGGLINHIGGHQDSDTIGTGAGLGGIAGSLAGILLSAHSRRKNMKDIAQNYDESSSVDPQAADTPNILRSLLTPISFSHHSGEDRAVKAMLGKEKDPTSYNNLEGAHNVMSHLPWLPLSYLTGIVGNLGLRDAATLKNKHERLG